MSIKYFAAYSLGRYRVIAENDVSAITNNPSLAPFDFKLVDTKFEAFQDAEDFCRAMNISLRDNFLETEDFDAEC